MGKRINYNTFLERAIKKHGDKYSYVESTYSTYSNKLTIVCDIHGDFNQSAKEHATNGHGCPKCYGNQTKSLEEVINDFKLSHGNRYNYNNVDYINNNTKVIIICPKHGEFQQTPKNHKNGSGCPKCSNNAKYSTEEFINKIKNKYTNITFDKSIYNGYSTNMVVTCKVHGDIIVNSKSLLKNEINETGCVKCAQITTSDIIDRFINVHGNRYNYSKVKYKGSKEKIIIICSTHGDFTVTIHNHIYGQGCPKCKSSKGEIEIMKILDKFNIKYIKEHKYKDCKYRNLLPFDFYLPDFNLCIEYDGIQHFKPLELFGGYNRFREQVMRDIIKNKYCDDKNINLLRIKYNESIYDKMGYLLNE